MANKFRSFVERRLAELNKNAFEAAREGGLERGFINDIIQGKKNSIRGNNLVKLAKALNVPLVTLIEETSEIGMIPEIKEWIEKHPETLRDEEFENADAIRSKYPKAQLTSAIAIYNLIKQQNGDTLLEPRPSRFIHENEFTIDLRIHYAVIIYDNFMSPEFNPGELALLDCNYPPVEGSNYLFKAESGDFETKVCIGKLVEFDEKIWKIKQWKVEHELRLPRDLWTSCHRVVGKIVR